MRHFFSTLIVAMVAGLPAAAGESVPAVDAVCRSAMGPYYAALVTSARGDADGTLRHVLLLKVRWDEVTRRSGSDVPGWLGDTATGRPLGGVIAGKIDSARHRLPRDVSGAHADLEIIRVLLRDARTRHAAATIDDALTDYHVAMERLSSHIGLSNEIALTPNDFTGIGLDVDRARSAWATVLSFPEPVKPPADWSDVAAATTSALAAIATATDRRDTTTVQQASQTLRSSYFDLLIVLSHRP